MTEHTYDATWAQQQVRDIPSIQHVPLHRLEEHLTCELQALHEELRALGYDPQDPFDDTTYLLRGLLQARAKQLGERYKVRVEVEWVPESTRVQHVHVFVPLHAVLQVLTEVGEA